MLIDRLHILPYLFLSREDDDDVRDIGKHDFRSVRLHPMLFNTNFLSLPRCFAFCSRTIFNAAKISSIESRLTPTGNIFAEVN